MVYRKELDGLRALAVISVIFYHANVSVFETQLFKGGYFGVDVFFVLTGYLMTSIIRSDLKAGKFSITEFYIRRAKRIIPALIIMLLGVSILAYQLLLPEDLVSYSESLKSSLYFGSNYYFNNENSYTAASSVFKPLLHTWSLAVEWQFYLIYPCLIWLVYNRFQSFIFVFIIAIATCSLLFAIHLVQSQPDQAFYLLPARAWELLLGGVATFPMKDYVNTRFSPRFSSLLIKYAPSLGFIALASSLLFVDHHVAHPSFVTMLPVIGTLLILIFAQQHEFITRLLSVKPMLFIGAISYSLYLWHQPIFVFYRFLNDEEILLSTFILLFLITISISYLSFRFIETPFRRRKSQRLLFITTAIAISSMSIFLYHSINNQGFPKRLGSLQNLFVNFDSLSSYKDEQEFCHTRSIVNPCVVKPTSNSRNIVLLGDSHAAVLGHHLQQLAIDANYGFLGLTQDACFGVDTIEIHNDTRFNENAQSRCNQESSRISSYIENHTDNPLTIVFSARLPMYLNKSRFDNEQGGIESGEVYTMRVKGVGSPEIELIKKLNYWESLGHDIVLIYPIPEAGWNVRQKAFQALSEDYTPSAKLKIFRDMNLHTQYETYLKRTSSAFEILDKVEGKRIKRIYPDRVFCADKLICRTHSNSELYYLDDDHLSLTGSWLLIQEIKNIL